MAKEKKIKLSFLGTNAEDVTGSMVLVESSTKKVLIECGLYQSVGATLDNYKINNERFDFRPNQIDYVFLCHSHADHIGRVPLLFKRGGHPTIIATENTKAIAKILWDDSARIMACDAQELSDEFGRAYQPIYQSSDVDEALSAYTEYPIGDIVQIDDDVKFQFVPSGHILNSAQLILWMREDNLWKKIVYTSDLGNTHVVKHYVTNGENPWIPGEPNSYPFIQKADIFIGETTYAGNQQIANKKKREKDMEKLEAAILQTLEEDGRVLIPVFALDRCQNMLTWLYELFGKNGLLGDTPVYVDSPMAIRLCDLYADLLEEDERVLWDDVCHWKNVKFISDAIESKAIRDAKQPCIVLASSGMLVKGRSVGWLSSMVSRPQDRVIFCGYSPEGSIGAILKEGKKKYVTVSGAKRANKCQVTNLTSYTSHIQYDTMLDYYGAVDAPKIALVHGEMEGKITFAQVLRERLSTNLLTSKVVVATMGYTVKI